MTNPGIQFYRFLGLIGLVLIVMTAFLGTTNLQSLKLTQISIETELEELKLNIGNLAKERESFIVKDNSEEALVLINQELATERIKLLGEVKKLEYITGRTQSYIQGGIVLLMIGIFLVTLALVQWYRLIKK